jgi:hypothetical protein
LAKIWAFVRFILSVGVIGILVNLAADDLAESFPTAHKLSVQLALIAAITWGLYLLTRVSLSYLIGGRYAVEALILNGSDELPQLHETQEQYLNRNGTTISHFYEELLLLKDRMNTDSARAVAEERHRFLEVFLSHFFTEWDARDLDLGD